MRLNGERDGMGRAARNIQKREEEGVHEKQWALPCARCCRQGKKPRRYKCLFIIVSNILYD